MKKLLTTLLVLLAATCGMLGFAACDQEPDTPTPPPSTVEHVHDWSEWTSDGAGNHTRTCKLDETHVETDKCEKSFEDVVTVPTCEEGGFTTHTCTVCDYTCTDSETPKLGHDWRYTFDEKTHMHSAVCHNDPSHKLEAEPCDLTNGLETKPTCTEDGFTTYICKTCLGKFTTYDKETQAATGHSFPETWQQMEGGKHYHTCIHENCEEKEEGTCNYTVEETTEPTCVAQGFTTHTCPGCGASEIDDYVDALNHDYTNAPYHSNNNGTHYRVCVRANCDEREESDCQNFTETATPATCTAEGTSVKTCTDCKHETVTVTEAAKGHDFKDYTYDGTSGNHTHTAKCANPDCEETETRSCVFSAERVISDPTCTQSGQKAETCTICQHEELKETPALSHSFGSWVSLKNGSHYRTCTRNCGETGERQEAVCVLQEGTSIPNSCTKAGSTAEKICPECGYTESGQVLDALGHKWENTKTPDGWTPGTEGKHFRVCATCKYREEKECEYSTHETPADCTNDGECIKTCSICQNVVTEVLTRLGHNIAEYTFKDVTDKEDIQHHYHVGYCDRCKEEVPEACQLKLSTTTSATCTTDGTSTYNCFRCGHIHTYVTEEATGHISTGSFTFNAEEHTHSSTCRSCGEVIESTLCTPDATKTKTQKQTCNIGGYTEKTCSVCNNSWREDVTPALGHDYQVSENSFIKQYSQHSVKCSRCLAGYPVRCSFVEETVQVSCTADGYTRIYCTECGGEQSKTIVRTNGHDYVYTYTGDSLDTHTHHISCRKCNLNQDADCTLKPLTTMATCTAPGDNDLICTVCANILKRDDSDALGHEFTYSYLYDDYHLRTCTRCNLKQTIKCTIDPVFEEGTCITPTVQINTCRDCKNQTKKTIENPMGHQWGKWTVQENNGEHVRKCEHCSLEEKRGGHDFSRSNFCDCGADGLTYELKDGHYVVKGNTSISNTEYIVIPSIHEEKSVEEIAGHAFRNFAKLKKIVIPATVKIIGDSGLNFCSKLTTVVIGGIGETGEAIPAETCALTTIGDYAFQGDEELTDFVLPATITSIGSYAFERCEKYGNITVPEGAVKIGDGAFNRTKFVKDANYENGALYLGSHLIRVDKTYDTKDDAGNVSFVIKPNTRSVAENAFEDCTNITHLTIYAGIEEFDKNAFKGCTGLIDVTFTKQEEQTDLDLVEAWFAITFENDDASPLNFAEIFHIDGVEGDIKIPKTALTIPVGTFRGDDIESIDLSDSTITSIGAGAFYNCTKLKTITIPASVTTIGEGAFYGCSSLAEIVISNDSKLTYIGDNAFAETAYYKNAAKWANGLLYLTTSDETQKHLIKANAGDGKAPEGVDTVRGEVVLDKATVTISARAFENCTELTHITIEENVVFIGKFAFNGCTALKAAHVKGTTSFLAWRFRPENPDSAELWIARGVAPNPGSEKNDASQQSMATLLKTTYQGEWTRYKTATSPEQTGSATPDE